MIERQIQALIEGLRTYVRQIIEDPPVSERSEQLRRVAEYILSQKHAGLDARLVFICTHNSRRSHLAHIWAATTAKLYGCQNVLTFSGGTEVTACDVRTIRALRRAGFSAVRATEGKNPVYLVQAFESERPIECFSKIYDQSGNPTTDFAALVCCSEVDARCPITNGATLRIPLHYDDPKKFDGTPQEDSSYDQRCQQIAGDMFLLMSMVGRQQT